MAIINNWPPMSRFAALYRPWYGQQKDGTIASQLAELRKQVAAAGHELVKEYIDDGYSGSLLDRPALEQLRADLKSDLFDAIFFLSPDRYSITSSARSRIDCGTVMPSALAVLRFTAISKFAGS